MPSPSSPWNALLSQAAPVVGASPVFSVTAAAANSTVNSFGNWSFGGNLDILALDYATAAPPTRLAIDASVPVMAFAAGTGGVGNWQSLSSIAITGSSNYVVLSGAETQAANGGGLLQAGNTSLKQISNTTAANTFYDLSGLDYTTVAGLALQGGTGSGVGEIALANQVLTVSPRAAPQIPAWSGIQVIDAVGDALGGTVNLANFGALTGLTGAYVLRTSGTTPLSAPAGNAVLQFLNSFGSASGPTPALTSALTIDNGPHNLAVNLQGVSDSGQNLTVSISGTVAPAGSSLALWLSNDGLSLDGGQTAIKVGTFNAVGYETITIALPSDSTGANRNAAFLGTSFFQINPGAYTGAIAKAIFQDDVATTIANATDLYLGRTTGGQSSPFASPTDAVGHDSIIFRRDGQVIQANGAGMMFLGANDVATISGAASGGIVMDVGGTATGTIDHVSGISVTGSATWQNLLQGSSGQIEFARDGTGAWSGTKIYKATAAFGVPGNGLMGIGNDTLVGGAGSPQPGSSSAGGDNFFGMGGLDTITLSAVPVRQPSTVWIGFYEVGHADNGSSGSRTGSAAVLNYYGQAITDLSGGREAYVDGYGLRSDYRAPPDGFPASGWATTVRQFKVGAGGDRLNFNPSDWASSGAILGLVDGDLGDIAAGPAVAQTVTSASRQVGASTSLVLDTLGRYASAAELAADLTSPGGSVTFAPGKPFVVGGSFHVLVGYATSDSASGAVHVADVWIKNVSLATGASAFSTNDSGLSVQAVDLVDLEGHSAGDLALLGANVAFPLAKSSGTNGNDTLSGNASDQVLDAGAGDDTVLLGSGHETIWLGPGADTVRSTLSNLLGDTFGDFDGADRLVLPGVTLKRSDLASSDGGRTFSITDGTIGGSFSLKDGLPGGDLMLAHVGGDTILTAVNYLPSLAEGIRVSTAAINGLANRSYLDGDTASSFSVRVEATGGAAFHNTLGTYQVGRDGTVGDVRILALDAKTVPGPLTLSGVAPGHELGFFLVQDGANVLPASARGGTLSFQSNGSALVLAVDGKALPGVNTFFSHDASRNPDGAQHVLSGVAPDGSGALRIGFEDMLRTGASDDDFQDVVVTVTATEWHF